MLLIYEVSIPKLFVENRKRFNAYLKSNSVAFFNAIDFLLPEPILPCLLNKIDLLNTFIKDNRDIV